jgi:hypothetical protein
VQRRAFQHLVYQTNAVCWTRFRRISLSAVNWVLSDFPIPKISLSSIPPKCAEVLAEDSVNPRRKFVSRLVQWFMVKSIAVPKYLQY